MLKPVLIVADDSEAMRWLVRAACRADFDEIREASDGRELFWQLVTCSRERPPSEVVVVTDMRMPHYTGLDVMSTYEDLAYHPPTVMMTAFPDAETTAKAARAGAALLAKPFTTAALRRLIERVRG